MKLTVLIIVFLTLTLIAFFIILSINSRSGSAPGLTEGKLMHCPHKPNCVCSDYPDDTDAWIEPIAYAAKDHSSLMQRIQATVEALGGEVQQAKKDYLAATFSSRFLGFVDDLEIRIDSEKNLIHFRSASRVGHSDLGVNRKRVAHLKEILTRTQKQ